MTSRGERLLRSRERISLLEVLWWGLQAPSCWDVAVEVATRSAVLRCPLCRRTGHWIDVPFLSAEHASAVRAKPGGELAGTDIADGAEVHAAFGQEWECSSCGHRTRSPLVGRIRSTKDASWRGHGRPAALAGNATEDRFISWCTETGKLAFDPTAALEAFCDEKAHRQRDYDANRRAFLRKVRGKQGGSV
jgi:hypothetical protein